MRGWLIDQKFTSLTELAKLVDQYTAVHRVEYIDKSSKGFHFEKSQTKKKWWHPSLLSLELKVD